MTTNVLNMKIESKIPDISGLVTTAVLNTKIVLVKNKIHDVNGLVTTVVLNTKIEEIENKFLMLLA